MREAGGGEGRRECRGAAGGPAYRCICTLLLTVLGFPFRQLVGLACATGTMCSLNLRWLALSSCCPRSQAAAERVLAHKTGTLPASIAEDIAALWKEENIMAAADFKEADLDDNAI